MICINKKKGISSEKLAYKHGRIIVAEAMADHMYSCKDDFVHILELNNQEDYITGDHRIDTESVFNLLMRAAGIEHERLTLVGKLMTVLTELPTAKSKKVLYGRLISLTDQIKEQIPKSGYLEMARKIYLSSPYSFVFNHLFALLDYVYWPDVLLLGDNDSNKPIIQKSYLQIEGFPVYIPFCLASSVDNIELENDPNNEFLLALKNYVVEKGISSYVLGYDAEETTAKLCAVSQYILSLSCLNKFGFNELPALTSSDIVDYSLDVWDFSYDASILLSGFKNVFINIPQDVFVYRKYIFKDTSFPKLQVVVPESEPGANDEQILDGFRIREKQIIRPDGEYFMIFFEYSYQESKIRRVLPIVINNIHATVSSFNLIDFHALVFLLGLYGILDKLPPQFSEGTLGKIIDSIKKATSQIAYVDADGSNVHSSGYHQTKEVRVDAYVRKLPAGQKPSEQAIELAKKYMINLEEGYTIVSPYVKNKNRS